MKGRLTFVKRILRLLPPLAGILTYCAGISYYSQLRQYPETYQAADILLSQEDYENMRETQKEEEDAPDLALWEKTQGVNVQNPQFKRQTSVSLWKIRGNLDILFEGFVKLQEEDINGCYLDAGTAQELFGSAEVAGSEIICQGRRLTIRGILREKEAILAIRPRAQESTDRLTLAGATASDAESFLLRYGVTGAAVTGAFLKEILQLLLLLFPISLAVCLFRSLKGSLSDGFRWILLFLAFFFIFQWIEIPDAMIPDKWSNFQFWKNWQETARNNGMAFFRQEKTGKELAQTICFLKGALCAALSVLAGQMSLRGSVPSGEKFMEYMEAEDE